MSTWEHSDGFYEKLAELYIGPWSNRGIRHLTKGIRTQCIALIRACRPLEAISDGLDLTGRVRPHFIRTNATGKRCFSTA